MFHWTFEIEKSEMDKHRKQCRGKHVGMLCTYNIGESRLLIFTKVDLQKI